MPYCMRKGRVCRLRLSADARSEDNSGPGGSVSSATCVRLAGEDKDHEAVSVILNSDFQSLSCEMNTIRLAGCTIADGQPVRSSSNTDLNLDLARRYSINAGYAHFFWIFHMLRMQKIWPRTSRGGSSDCIRKGQHLTRCPQGYVVRPVRQVRNSAVLARTLSHQADFRIQAQWRISCGMDDCASMPPWPRNEWFHGT
ncbi:hypothetical protein BV25DRAFT_727317 [Artomyces pyxidatus]|uniref:Uncharacterized protein n=1 Tax=Artomyces pyxidatus TaxID=48021 RepID=A0ACB8SYE2_9AGAM|nr:hypothetical protein BV25DRAFT_727317 [Artomyces pyxidatus]